MPLSSIKVQCSKGLKYHTSVHISFNALEFSSMFGKFNSFFVILYDTQEIVTEFLISIGDVLTLVVANG